MKIFLIFTLFINHVFLANIIPLLHFYRHKAEVSKLSIFPLGYRLYTDISYMNLNTLPGINVPLFLKSNVTLSPISINGAHSETLVKPLLLIHFMAW